MLASTSQWNVIEGAIMAFLQYEDPDVYQEVQVAGASKGADAPVGGSFNNNSDNRMGYWHWQYKALGSYELPYEVSFSASVRVTKGEPYGRTVNTTGLTQGAITLPVEPQGTFFYDTVRLVDLRFAKRLTLGRTKIEGLFDVFNVNNSPAVLGRNNQTGASFGAVLTTVNPRIARLGVRWRN